MTPLGAAHGQAVPGAAVAVGSLSPARGARMLARAEAALAGMATDARRRATMLAVTVLCLLMATRLSNVLESGEPGQVPFTVALFVLPLLCAFPGTRRWLTRYRWPVLAVQAALTWVPFAVFGGSWQQGIDGLLAGMVLLLAAAPVSWLVAGGLLAVDVTLRATVTGLPHPPWHGVIQVVIYYVDNAVIFFGMVRLAQIVGEVEDARGQAADLAVARERLDAARTLETAVGERLAGISASVAAARALAHDAARARAQVAAAGAAAREAVAAARTLAATRRAGQEAEPATAPGGRAVIGSRLAWAVLVTVLLMVGGGGVAALPYYHLSTGVTVLSAADIAGIVAVQLYVSRAVRDGGRPRQWLVVLAVQAVLVYAFSFGFSAFSGGYLAPFLAGPVLLLVPGWRRWAGFAAVVVSNAVLCSALPMSELTPTFAPRPLFGLLQVCEDVVFGLLVYGLSRLARLARELEGLRGQLARMAGVAERLRVARDVHDLLGLGLSAVALKADLAGALIGRDDTRAAAELDQMTRICATARADIGQVTGQGPALSLARELHDARQLLASLGIEVRAGDLTGPLPGTADAVLAPVLREAVTNILRHATATTCVIDVTADGGAVRLAVTNDGVTGGCAAGQPAGDGTGRGLANLRARVQAADGRLACGQAADGQFTLTAEVPLAGARSADQLPVAAYPAARTQTA
jgi:two-component system, NarL family, sensor histidine kinase DesK